MIILTEFEPLLCSFVFCYYVKYTVPRQKFANAKCAYNKSLFFNMLIGHMLLSSRKLRASGYKSY